MPHITNGLLVCPVIKFLYYPLYKNDSNNDKYEYQHQI